VSGLVLNIVNGVLKLINALIKISIFIVEHVFFTFYRGVGELLESGLKAGDRLVHGRVIR
jgi:hypothetical protein